LRIVLVPIICVGLSILLIDIKINYKKEADVIYPVFFILIIGCLVLLYNLNSIYKIIVEETTITKGYFLLRKRETISYAFIKSMDKEFISGGWISDVGQISDGYYRYVFQLVNGKELIVSPLCFKNYNELIIAINNNRNDKND
jgi:hypothetical protein